MVGMPAPAAMRARAWSQAAVAFSAALCWGAVAGCGPLGNDPDAADPSPEEMRSEVRGTTEELVDRLQSAGLRPFDGSGSYSACGAGSQKSVEYATGVGFRPRGDIAAAVDDAEQILTDDGWEVQSSERDDEQSYVTARRSPLTVSVIEDRFDEGILNFGVQHGCVEDRADSRDFDSEPLDLP